MTFDPLSAQMDRLEVSEQPGGCYAQLDLCDGTCAVFKVPKAFVEWWQSMDKAKEAYDLAHLPQR